MTLYGINICIWHKLNKIFLVWCVATCKREEIPHSVFLCVGPCEVGSIKSTVNYVDLRHSFLVKV
jgi:hypothetical protein